MDKTGRIAGAASLTVQIQDSRVEAARLTDVGRDGRSDRVLHLDGNLDAQLIFV